MALCTITTDEPAGAKLQFPLLMTVRLPAGTLTGGQSLIPSSGSIVNGTTQCLSRGLWYDQDTYHLRCLWDFSGSGKKIEVNAGTPGGSNYTATASQMARLGSLFWQFRNISSVYTPQDVFASTASWTLVDNGPVSATYSATINAGTSPLGSAATINAWAEVFRDFNGVRVESIAVINDLNSFSTRFVGVFGVNDDTATIFPTPNNKFHIQAPPDAPADVGSYSSAALETLGDCTWRNAGRWKPTTSFISRMTATGTTPATLSEKSSANWQFAKTVITGTNNAGTTSLTVGSIANISTGDRLHIYDANLARSEYVSVHATTAPSGSTVTLDSSTPLAFTHTAAQADVVEKLAGAGRGSGAFVEAWITWDDMSNATTKAAFTALVAAEHAQFPDRTESYFPEVEAAILAQALDYSPERRHRNGTWLRGATPHQRALTNREGPQKVHYSASYYYSAYRMRSAPLLADAIQTSVLTWNNYTNWTANAAAQTGPDDHGKHMHGIVDRGDWPANPGDHWTRAIVHNDAWKCTGSRVAKLAWDNWLTRFQNTPFPASEGGDGSVFRDIIQGIPPAQQAILDTTGAMQTAWSSKLTTSLNYLGGLSPMTAGPALRGFVWNQRAYRNMPASTHSAFNAWLTAGAGQTSHYAIMSIAGVALGLHKRRYGGGTVDDLKRYLPTIYYFCKAGQAIGYNGMKWDAGGDVHFSDVWWDFRDQLIADGVTSLPTPDEPGCYPTRQVLGSPSNSIEYLRHNGGATQINAVLDYFPVDNSSFNGGIYWTPTYGGSWISTTVAAGTGAENSAGQKILVLTSVTGISVNQLLRVFEPTPSRDEYVVVASIAGNKVTCVNNLAFTHLAGDSVNTNEIIPTAQSYTAKTRTIRANSNWDVYRATGLIPASSEARSAIEIESDGGPSNPNGLVCAGVLSGIPEHVILPPTVASVPVSYWIGTCRMFAWISSATANITFTSIRSETPTTITVTDLSSGAASKITLLATGSRDTAVVTLDKNDSQGNRKLWLIDIYSHANFTVAGLVTMKTDATIRMTPYRRWFYEFLPITG